NPDSALQNVVLKKYIVLKSPKIIPGQEYFSFH
ncbi:hypothetical protein CWATWH0402_3771, partial [Crocosphaera watsonii WH 0402]